MNMGITTAASSNVMLGLIAGMTIFLGLPVARWKAASEKLRGSLALASAGVLFFLIIEVGFHAIEMVEGTAKSGAIGPALMQGGILVAGLVAGLIGLAWLEESRGQKRVEGASPFDIATMIAIGIGLHNFAEGLAIGQSFSGGEVSLGWILVIGFALHNATEGFGIAGPLVGQDVPIGRLLLLGLIGGGPTALGSLLGGAFVNPNIELLFLALAVGSLIYVTRELLRLRFATLNSVAAMSALTVGLLLGIGSELVVEVASAASTSSTKDAVQEASAQIAFDTASANPAAVSIARGQAIKLINNTERGLEFEANGVLAREAFLPPHGQLTVKVVGPEGQYSLSPEGGGAGSAVLKVAGGSVDSSEDLVQALAAITTIEGHANAAHDLHVEALEGKSQNPALDLKRAGKHAHHPMHELLDDTTPRAKMVQKLLTDHSMLEPIKESLSEFSELAGKKDVPDATFEKEYQELVDKVEEARQQIGGTAYDSPEFKSKVVLAVLELAEGEYKEAVEGGSIKVEQEAVPGKDAYLEYQDTRGFLKACSRILDKLPQDDFKPDGRAALATLLDVQFKTVDPAKPSNPTPFRQIEELFERIEKSVS
jgi:zinc transporter, ZIP family